MEKDFIFQTKFSRNADRVIKKEYEVSSDDKILMAVWAGKLCSVPLRERGFLFTKRGFAWNFPAVEISGEDGENKERSQCNCDFLSRESTEFKLTFSKVDGIEKELHLKTGITEFTFLFPSDFEKEKIEELEKIIRDYFTGYFDEHNYAEKAKKNSALLGLFGIPDFFSCLGENASKEWNKLKAKIKIFFKKEEKTEPKKEEVPKAEGKQNLTVNKKENGFLRFLRHTLDLCADLLIFFAVVYFYKADCSKCPIEKISDILKEPVINYFVALLVFVLLKAFLILTKKNAQKTVFVLLLFIILALTLLFQLLVKEFFIVYTIIVLLLLLTLQFSMNYSKQGIKIKIQMFFVFAFAIYIIMHAFDEVQGTIFINVLRDTLYLDVNWLKTLP